MTWHIRNIKKKYRRTILTKIKKDFTHLYICIKDEYRDVCYFIWKPTESNNNKMSVIIKKTKKKPSLLGFLMYEIEKGLRAVYQKAILTIIFSM